MSEATYKFDYAIRCLRDAIDYAQQTGDFQQARIWSNRVEASYNADIEAEKELAANANEGAKLMHSLATGVMPADIVDVLRWSDEQVLPPSRYTGVTMQKLSDEHDRQFNQRYYGNDLGCFDR